MRKKRIAFLSILSVLLVTYLLGVPVIADTPEWGHTYGGTEYDEVYALIECSGGDFVIAGVTRSYGGGNQDGWLIRTDSDGNHLWNYSYGGGNTEEFYSMVECSNGDFALGGTSQITGVAAWILRTDESGTHLWNYSYDPGMSSGRDLVECSTGGFALLGTNHLGTGEDDLWLLRTDDDGNPLWNRTYGNPGYESARALVECSNGDFALLGITLVGMQDDAWLIRTNSTGHHLWNATYGDTENEMPFDLIETSGGGLVFTGNYMNQIWLVHTDASGAVVWEQKISDESGLGSVSARSLVECSDGGFATVGQTDGLGAEHYDFLLARMDSDGNHLWFKIFGGADWEAGKALVQMANGDFVIAGETDSYGAGLYDAWLIRTTDTAPTTPTPPIPGFPVEALILGLAVSLGIGIFYRRRRT